MEIDAKALDMFRELRSGNLVVLATDNMDCFAEALSTRKFAAGIFDDVLCSSELKCLKEHPREFFGPWLAKHGMRFADAILIDDNPANCTAFELAGGQTVLYNHGRDFFEKLMGKLRAEKE